LHRALSRREALQLSVQEFALVAAASQQRTPKRAGPRTPSRRRRVTRQRTPPPRLTCAQAAASGTEHREEGNPTRDLPRIEQLPHGGQAARQMSNKSSAPPIGADRIPQKRGRCARPSRPARPRCRYRPPAENVSKAAQRPSFHVMPALTVLVTALVTALQRVLALAGTSPTGVSESPATSLVSTTRALDRLERPRPGAIVAVTPRQENRASTGPQVG
jgi:hypothetical protein